MGWYGLLAIEGMAERRPVVGYIREDFARIQPDLPVVSAEPATVYEVLRGLVRDPARRTTLGTRGPAYVERIHDAKAVAELLLADYHRVLEGRRSGGAAGVAGPPLRNSPP
jgi:hypothetical protein